EALSPELLAEIKRVKAACEYDGYEFHRLTNYNGFWVRHCGWYPDTKIRIFDRRITKWEGIIHEKLIINSNKPAILLKGDCLHYSYYTLEQHYQQTEKFSTLSAKHMFEREKKASVIKMWVSPIIKFFSDYILKLGFLDGAAGFTICRVSAYTSYLKYKKLRELY
ncbi:MAG: glycosyltransferase family 2 protein, partial [Bacteroidia bacterium]